MYVVPEANSDGTNDANKLTPVVRVRKRQVTKIKQDSKGTLDQFFNSKSV